MNHIVQHGDCLQLMKEQESQSVDVVYLDPPFFSNKKHSLTTRDRSKMFSFDDSWKNHQDYAVFMLERLQEVYRLLRSTGSIFLHCDRNANHILRFLLDEVFGRENFRSEIIWFYKRWSNSAKGLLPSHQTIFFYSKSEHFVFNPMYGDYSESTNIDQILQKRARDKHGKAVYATTEKGDTLSASPKRGVPLSDVWDIPFLNPKARERTGYPTQKPLLLLERIIQLSTDPEAIVLDPFCGSGTTLVAAKLLGRRAIGFDSSEEAINLTLQRLENPVKTESELLKKGRDAYLTANTDALALLQGLEVLPIHRNAGIDAILKAHYQDNVIPIRVQREDESLSEAAFLLYKAAQKKGARKAFLVSIQPNVDRLEREMIPELITVIESPKVLLLNDLLSRGAEAHSVDQSKAIGQ
jgi:site-specific DNA-methyltransferase (adenine-specific)